MAKYIEKRIVSKVVQCLTNAGYEFDVSYERGEGEAEHVMMNIIPPDDNLGDAWIYLVYGSGNRGLDIIDDYTNNLIDVLKPAIEFVKSLEVGDIALSTYQGN